MGNSTPAPTPSMVAMPKSPTPSGFYNQGQQAVTQSQGASLGQNQQYLPQYAQLAASLFGQQMPQYGQSLFQNQQQFSPEYIKLALANQNLADPTGTRMAEAGKQGALADYQLGSSMSPDDQRIFEQNLASGQLRAGRGTGISDIVDQAKNLYLTGQGLKQQRFNNLQSAYGNFNTERQIGGLNAPTPNVPTINPAAFASEPLTAGQGVNLAQSTYANRSANRSALNNYNLQAAQLGLAYPQSSLTNTLLGMAASPVGTIEGQGAAQGMSGGGNAGAPTLAAGSYGGVGQPSYQTAAWAMPAG